MSDAEVDRLERYLDRRFGTLEERVTRIEEKMGNLEKDMATLRALGRLVTGVATALIVVGVIAGLSYLAR
jgi:hypothetical protein